MICYLIPIRLNICIACGLNSDQAMRIARMWSDYPMGQTQKGIADMYFGDLSCNLEIKIYWNKITSVKGQRDFT